MTLLDENNIAGGDPGLIRAEAARLSSVCEEIAGVVSRLRAVTTRGVWDSSAGTAFAAHVGEVPASLDAVRERLQTAANLLPPYAGLLEDAQQRMRHLETRYTHAQVVVESCDRQLEMLPPQAPERPALMTRRGDAAQESYRIQETYQRVSDEIRADEKRLAARLYDVAPELDDPQAYDIFEGLTALGTGPIATGPASWIARPLAFLAFADPVGKLGLRAVYGQGTYADVALATKNAGLGVVKAPTGPGARAQERARTAARSRETSPVADRVKGAGGGTSRQTTARVKVRAKHAGQDLFEDMTGIRLINDMTADWVFAAALGPVGMTRHVVGYTLASAQKVDSSVGTARTVGTALPGARETKNRCEDRRPTPAPTQ